MARTYPGRFIVSTSDGGTIAPRVVLREQNYKYVYSRAYPPQLYDLSHDPDELRNLSGETEVNELETELKQRIEQHWDLDGLSRRVGANQAARRLIDAALNQGRQEAWDFQPRAQAHDTQYVRRGDAFPDVERRGYLPYPNQ